MISASTSPSEPPLWWRAAGFLPLKQSHARPPSAAPRGAGDLFERIAKRRGRKIVKVALPRRILTLCFYGLREGDPERIYAATAGSILRVLVLDGGLN